VKPSTPPRLAFWLLSRQLGGYRAESLVGDLNEEYAHGRSDGWYWGQVLVAVATSYRNALTRHGLRLLLAFAAGWCALVIGIVLLGLVGSAADRALGSWCAEWPAKRLEGLKIFSGLVWTISAGCIDVVVGRLIVMIYRPHPRVIAAVFALSILAYMLPSLYALAVQSSGDPRNFTSLAEQLVQTFFWMASAWFGARWQMHLLMKSTKEELG
jgi:hypothetical protein